MKNSDALNFFKNMSKDKLLNQNSVKLAKNSDFSNIDAKFILSHSNKNTKILDLGSGSGLIVNKIHNQVDSIVAIEPFAEFTKFITNSPNITIVNTDILTFKTNKLFDLITMFAVVQYFNQKEIIKIYSKYKNNLKTNGKLIIKGQFGIKDDVIISGFSNELKKNYYSQYRYINKEIEILKKIGYKKINITDIYPPKHNRWKNTHFYAIVAEK